MKKVIRIFCALIALVLVGCVSFDEGKGKKAGEAFIESIYTVDTKEVTNFKTPIPPEITEEDQESKENYKKQSDAFLERMKSIDKNIIPLMTKEGYEEASTNKFNILITKICSENKDTAQVTHIYFGENMYEDFVDTNKISYLYAVEYDFISSDGRTIQADVGKGVVELVKDDGKWKVCSFNIIQFPKL
ncbi:hypothetical protein [Clostridium sp.]|jgi:hypothetical protein|uniref:hypothetical protein n=1 Tax=Clostridium sp. TaxID=1506 RepID=UPI003EED6ACB